MTEGTAGNGHLLGAGDWEEKLGNRARGIPANWWVQMTTLAKRRSKPSRHIHCSCPPLTLEWLLHFKKCTEFVFHPNFGLTKTWNSTDKEAEKTRTAWSHLDVGPEKAELIDTESRSGDQELRGGGIGEMLAKGYKLPLTRWIHAGDLMCSVVIIVYNSVDIFESC